MLWLQKEFAWPTDQQPNVAGDFGYNYNSKPTSGTIFWGCLPSYLHYILLASNPIYIYTGLYCKSCLKGSLGVRHITAPYRAFDMTACWKQRPHLLHMVMLLRLGKILCTLSADSQVVARARSTMLPISDGKFI